MAPELVDWIWKAAIGFVVGLIWYVIRDRKKQKLDNKLAEETLQPNVKKVGIEVLESQILAMSNAWEQERQSKDRQIEELKRRCQGSEDKLAEAEKTIGELRQQASSLSDQLREFKEKIEHLTALVETKEAT